MGQGAEKRKEFEIKFPDTSTLVPDARLIPFSVIATAAPAGTLDGLRVVSVGVLWPRAARGCKKQGSTSKITFRKPRIWVILLVKP
jgi:hypothetical protein